MEVIMHNLISFNQLAYWNQTEKEFGEESKSLINEYFECLTECDNDSQSCRRICKNILTS